MQIHLDARATLLSWVIVPLLAAGFAIPVAAQKLEPVNEDQQVLNDNLAAYRLVCGEGHKIRLPNEGKVHAQGFARAGNGAKARKRGLQQAKKNCEDNLNDVLRAKTYCDPTVCLEGDECWPASYVREAKYVQQGDVTVKEMTPMGRLPFTYIKVTCRSRKPVYLCSKCGAEPSKAVLRGRMGKLEQVAPRVVKNFASSLTIPEGEKHPSVVTTDENQGGAKHPPRKKKPDLTVRPKGQKEITTDGEKPLELFCSEKKANPGSAELNKVERGTRLAQANHHARWEEAQKLNPVTRLTSTLWLPGKGKSPKAVEKSIEPEDVKRACTEKFEQGLKQWYSCKDDKQCADGQDCTQVVAIPEGAVKAAVTSEVKRAEPEKGPDTVAVICELKLASRKGKVELKCECLDCPQENNPCFEGLGCLESGGEFTECSSEMSDVEFEIFDEFEDCVYSKCDDREDEDSFFACASEQCGALADECESAILPEPDAESPVSPGRTSEDMTDFPPLIAGDTPGFTTFVPRESPCTEGTGRLFAEPLDGCPEPPVLPGEVSEKIVDIAPPPALVPGGEQRAPLGVRAPENRLEELKLLMDIRIRLGRGDETAIADALKYLRWKYGTGVRHGRLGDEPTDYEVLLGSKEFGQAIRLFNNIMAAQIRKRLRQGDEGAIDEAAKLLRFKTGKVAPGGMTDREWVATSREFGKAFEKGF